MAIYFLNFSLSNVVYPSGLHTQMSALFLFLRHVADFVFRGEEDLAGPLCSDGPWKLFRVSRSNAYSEIHGTQKFFRRRSSYNAQLHRYDCYLEKEVIEDGNKHTFYSFK